MFFSACSAEKPEKQRKPTVQNSWLMAGRQRHALLAALPWQQRSQLAMDPTPSQRSLGATSARKVIQVHHGAAIISSGSTSSTLFNSCLTFQLNFGGHKVAFKLTLWLRDNSQVKGCLQTETTGCEIFLPHQAGWWSSLERFGYPHVSSRSYWEFLTRQTWGIWILDFESQRSCRSRGP